MSLVRKINNRIFYVIIQLDLSRYSAVKLAMEPPLTNNPSAESGNPSIDFNQLIVVNSICSAPAPTIQAVGNTLNPLAKNLLIHQHNY